MPGGNGYERLSARFVRVAICRLSLFVVCRYLSRIESPTFFGTTASRAFRAVSRETPYFAASSFSRIFSQLASLREVAPHSLLDLLKLCWLAPATITGLPQMRRRFRILAQQRCQLRFEEEQLITWPLLMPSARLAERPIAARHQHSVGFRCCPEIACNGMPA